MTDNVTTTDNFPRLDQPTPKQPRLTDLSGPFRTGTEERGGRN